MSNMQNLQAQLSEKQRQQQVYEAAMRELTRKRQLREGEGLALMYAWDAFGQRSQGKTFMGKLSKAAAFFCIGFAFLTPCLLFARYML